MKEGYDYSLGWSRSGGPLDHFSTCVGTFCIQQSGYSQILQSHVKGIVEVGHCIVGTQAVVINQIRPKHQYQWVNLFENHNNDIHSSVPWQLQSAVEPLNKGHLGISHFVLCWETVPFSEVKNVLLWERVQKSVLCKEVVPFSEGPLSEVSL